MSTILHQQRKEEKMKILRKIKRIISEPSPADLTTLQDKDIYLKEFNIRNT